MDSASAVFLKMNLIYGSDHLARFDLAKNHRRAFSMGSVGAFLPETFEKASPLRPGAFFSSGSSLRLTRM